MHCLIRFIGYHSLAAGNVEQKKFTFNAQLISSETCVGEKRPSEASHSDEVAWPKIRNVCNVCNTSQYPSLKLHRSCALETTH